MNKISKTEAKEQIKEFFSRIKDKTPQEIKKIKKLAMRHNIALKDLRKKFCKKCFSPNLKIQGIKNKIKRVQCEDCEYIARLKLKN